MDDSLSSVDIDIVGQTTLKHFVHLCKLFYFYVLKLTLFALKLPLAQLIGIKTRL